VSRNPFSSEWVRGGADERLRPPGTVSYVAGAHRHAIAFHDHSQLLDKAVARHGARDAAIFCAEHRTLTWYDLQREADDVASGLLALGIRRGNRVGIWARRTASSGFSRSSALRVSAPCSSISPGLPECRTRLRAEQGSLPRADHGARPQGERLPDTLRQLAPEIDRPGGEPLLESRRLPHLKHVIVLDDAGRPKAPLPARALRFADFVGQAGPAQRLRLPALAAALDPDDAINIQFTSGTTGAPKGATLSHFNIVNNARSRPRPMAFTPSDRLCIPVPLYHCFGMVLGVLCCVAEGATMVFPGEGFDAQATIAAVERHRCTALHGVPTMFIAMLALHTLRDQTPVNPVEGLRLFAGRGIFCDNMH